MTVDYEAAKTYALSRLERDVAPRFCYHDITHTRDDVLPAAERLGEMCGLKSADMLLLKTAALFHDIGFVERAHAHEKIGAEIAADHLPRLGYAPAQVAAIQGMIRATAMPQAPRTLLEQILCDADLDVLGRADFLSRNLLLYAELHFASGDKTLTAWFAEQRRFVAEHSYHTPAAHALRDDGKQSNLSLPFLMNA